MQYQNTPASLHDIVNSMIQLYASLAQERFSKGDGQGAYSYYQRICDLLLFDGSTPEELEDVDAYAECMVAM